MVRIGTTPSSVSGVSALPVFFTRSFPLPFSSTSQAHPEPNCVAPAVENSFLNSSREPKSRSIAAASGPEGSAVFLIFSKFFGSFSPELVSCLISSLSGSLSLSFLPLYVFFCDPTSSPSTLTNSTKRTLRGRHRVPEEGVVPDLCRVVERRRRLA